MYEYRVVKEETNLSLAYADNTDVLGFNTTVNAFAPTDVIVRYVVQVKGSFFLWHDVRTFKSLRKAIEFKQMLETFADEEPADNGIKVVDDANEV